MLQGKIFVISVLLVGVGRPAAQNLVGNEDFLIMLPICDFGTSNISQISILAFRYSLYTFGHYIQMYIPIVIIYKD